ncbi:pilus assembly protein TadG-related protein [Streptomyces thermodiastaticus]
MTRPRHYGDAGQAFPIYLTVVAGLLFLAFAYFAVGQAAVNRSSAQTAADAAALAAAQNTRDQLAGAWVKDVLDPTKWQDIFQGNAQGLQSSCWRASQLAQQNDAHLLECDADGPLGYTIEVQTNKTMGKSLVPATETTRSKARATAVIEPLCSFQLPGTRAGHEELPRLSCKKDWDIDPDHLTDLPEPQDLFDVHLVDR